MPKLRTIYDLTTEEAYDLASQIAEDLPPREAVENEDWGRDYLLQKFQQLTETQLSQLGLTWDTNLEMQERNDDE